MLARNTDSHAAETTELPPAQEVDFARSTSWIWRIASLTVALVLARQVLWIFYYSPLFGDTSAIDRWFATQRCLVPAWCGPRSLPFHHLGVLMLLGTILFFGLALWRWPGLWANMPAVPSLGWRQRPRLTRFAVALLIIAAAEAVVYQAYLWFVTAQAPPNWIWLGGIVAALLAAFIADLDDTAGLARTGANITIAAGMVMTLLGLAAALAERYDSALLMLPGLLFFAFGTLWSRRAASSYSSLDHALMLGLMAAMLVLAMSRAWLWRFAFVGDEWGFYFLANDLLKNPARLAAPFYTHDVNHYHTIFSSALQSGILWLTRANVFGWRLSSVLPSVLALPGVYILGNWLAGRSAAILSAVLYAGAHVVLMFSMVPYNNTQALTILTIAPALFIFARRSSGTLRLVLAGMVLGIGFALFGLARMVVLPMAILILLDGWPSLRRILHTGLIIAAATVIVAAPMLFNLENWRGLLKATPVQSEAAEKFTLAEQMGRNAAAGAMIFVATAHAEATHYLAGAHTDPATALLLMAGMGATLFSLRSSKPARSWFFASTLFWLAASAIQQYDWVANTRMYILVPLYTLYAGIGGHALAQLLVPYSSRIRMFLIILLAAAAMILNQWHINQVSLVYSRDAWSVFGFALQQFQVTANLDETTPSGGLPIFVVQDDTTYSPLTWIIPAYEAKPERMTLFTPDEVLQDVPSCTKIESAANHPAMFLIPANDAQREALRAYVITCWPGAVETVLSNRTGHPLWVRFLTPSTPAFETYPGPPPTANSEAAQPKPESPLASPLAIPSPSPPVVPQATPSSIASPLETP